MGEEKKNNSAKSRESSRFRILAIERILLDYKEISTRRIIDILDKRLDIKCDRKTIYQDMVVINRFIPVDVSYGKNSKWIVSTNIWED
jgi:hypothetical protein